MNKMNLLFITVCMLISGINLEASNRRRQVGRRDAATAQGYLALQQLVARPRPTSASRRRLETINTRDRNAAHTIRQREQARRSEARRAHDARRGARAPAARGLNVNSPPISPTPYFGSAPSSPMRTYQGTHNEIGSENLPLNTFLLREDSDDIPSEPDFSLERLEEEIGNLSRIVQEVREEMSREQEARK